MTQMLFKNGMMWQNEARSARNLASSVQNWAICVAQLLEKPYPIWQSLWLEKPYPIWHRFGVQNPTLSGTLLENPILCGTGIGQKGNPRHPSISVMLSMEGPPPSNLGPGLYAFFGILYVLCAGISDNLR